MIRPELDAERVCWVAGAGEFYEAAFRPRLGDFVIAADAGLSHVEHCGARADLILGDFDSLGHIPHGENVRVYPPEKDDTDMMLAVKEGLAAGCKWFELFGGLGGRLAHTLANVQTLAWLSLRGAHGFLRGADTNVTTITNDEIVFGPHESGYISLFAIGPTARGVTLRGLKYELQDADLDPFFPLGVSNEFTGKPAQITVKNGTLAVVWNPQSAD